MITGINKKIVEWYIKGLIDYTQLEAYKSKGLISDSDFQEAINTKQKLITLKEKIPQLNEIVK